MSTLKKIAGVAGAVLVVGFVSLIIYGLVTGCPDVAVYVYCPADLR